MSEEVRKHSENLRLDGEVPDFIKELEISKDIPKPNGWASTSSKWDHLLVKLDLGDSVVLNTTESVSFTSRARNIGYCIATRKIGEDEVRVWFEGLNPNRKVRNS